MKRILLTTALAAALLVPATARAQDAWVQQVRAQLSQYGQTFEANGYHLTHRIYTGSLNDDGDEVGDDRRGTKLLDRDTDEDGTLDGDEDSDHDGVDNEDEDDADETCVADDDDRDGDAVSDEDENDQGEDDNDDEGDCDDEDDDDQEDEDDGEVDDD